MIKLTSLYPYANLHKVTQEFYDDHFVVNSKSISSEHKETYSYEKIAEISDQFNASGSQQQFIWILLCILSPVVVFLHNEIHSIPALLHTIQTLYILGIAVFALGFFKHWHIFILDENGFVLTTIKMTRRNRDAVYQAIDLIQSKSEGLQQTSIVNPFPEVKPVFEHSYFDFSELEKTIDRFYDEKIIGVENNFLSERVYTLKYKSLTGRIFRGKLGIKIWQTILSWAMLVWCLLLGLRYVFDFNLISGKPLWYIGLPLPIFSVALWPLIFVKRNVIGFYGVDSRIAYWAFVNKADKEKFEKIIKFVQSRIPAENKEASHREQV